MILQSEKDVLFQSQDLDGDQKFLVYSKGKWRSKTFCEILSSLLEDPDGFLISGDLSLSQTNLIKKAMNIVYRERHEKAYSA